jgi:hypothetical protein
MLECQQQNTKYNRYFCIHYGNLFGTVQVMLRNATENFSTAVFESKKVMSCILRLYTIPVIIFQREARIDVDDKLESLTN